ncbi:MAG: hypothetical protein Q9M13_09885 [Mariprofundales bacterium]|nr:hypothetical protein [Mariprofundales bacterium]
MAAVSGVPEDGCRIKSGMTQIRIDFGMTQSGIDFGMTELIEHRHCGLDPQSICYPPLSINGASLCAH